MIILFNPSADVPVCLSHTVPSRRQELAAHTPEGYYRLANPTLTAGTYSWQPHPPQRYNQ